MNAKGEPTGIVGITLDNKYHRWHDAIIERARLRPRMAIAYFERHHIVPRSLGGTDATSNIVALTYREHFLIHWLLTKFTTGTARRKMQYALACMCMRLAGDGRIIASWQYAIARRAYALKDRTAEHRSAIGRANKGRIFTDLHRAKMSLAQRARQLRRGFVRPVRIARVLKVKTVTQFPGGFGLKASDATKEKMSKSLLGNQRAKGFKHSAATISRRLGNQYALGLRHSADARARMSASHTGYLHSDAARQRMSEARKRYWKARHDVSDNREMDEYFSLDHVDIGQDVELQNGTTLMSWAKHSALPGFNDGWQPVPRTLPSNSI